MPYFNYVILIIFQCNYRTRKETTVFLKLDEKPGSPLTAIRGQYNLPFIQVSKNYFRAVF